jgi:diketogulonate reductase-like aldo/keto reductase
LCEANGVAVTAYSPYGHNEFPSANSAGGRVLSEIAKAHGATPRQVALQFLIRRSSVVTIPKASSVAHMTENAGASDLQLTADEIAQIDAAFPRGRRPRDLPML